MLHGNVRLGRVMGKLLQYMKSIWNNLKTEVSNNPLRSSLAVLQTFTILLGVGKYVLQTGSHPATRVSVPYLQLQKEAGTDFFAGYLMVQADRGPSIDSFTVKVSGLSDAMTSNPIREIKDASIETGQVDTIARIRTQRPPDQILFCFEGRNSQGGALTRRVIVKQDGSEVGKSVSERLKSYQMIQQVDLSQKPTC